MKKIIVVYGDNHTGKTTVIDQVYHKLVELGAQSKIPRKEGSGDFEAVLLCGEKTIAFYSCGDYKSYVDEQVEKYKEYDILITAYNKRFATIGWVWLANSEIIEKVEKYEANDADNIRALNDILSRI
jgi:Cdc6-like AAA superfamily ATPase